MPAGTTAPTLTLRELNRALLARQMLLSRQRVGVVDAIERLACLQAQWAPSPYIALWSRIAGFARDDLTKPIDRGDVVKTTIMRATLHLVSAREYPAYHRATLEGRFGAWRPPGAPTLAELEKTHRRVLAFASKQPRSRQEIEQLLAKDAPQDARMKSWLLLPAITATNGLVWEPSGAHFEYRKLARIMDVRRFRDERGRELFDLARAPRPSAETVAPARFLARFDAAILGHDAAERTRILPAEYKRQVIFSAEVWTTFLVDGFVAGR